MPKNTVKKTKTHILLYDENGHEYDIRLARIRTHHDISDWQRQLGEKNWVTGDMFDKFTNLALADLAYRHSREKGASNAAR